jgi:hypothetical protein
MVSFSTDPPVLRFRHKSPGAAFCWLGWPAWGFQVVAPRMRERRLNLFQRAILGMCRAGKCRADEIAEQLMVGVDLAAHILVELRQLGLLDYRDKVTARAVEMLEEDEADRFDEPVVGYVFSDLFTGDIWPRYAPGDLPYTETKKDEKGFLKLRYGSVGDPKWDSIFVVRPQVNETIFTRRPEPHEILRAVRLHQRQYGWEETVTTHDAPALARVSYVTEEPESFLLAVRVRRDVGTGFVVDDPFGIGESTRVRNWIEKRLDITPQLRGFLQRVTSGNEDAVDTNSLQQKAEWEVESRLTIAVRRDVTLHEHLVAMQRAYFEAQVPQSPDDKWDDVTIKAQKVAERLFRWVNETFHRDGLHGILSKNKDFNSAILNDIASDLGFTAPLPPSLTRVHHGKIQAAEELSSGSLRALLILAMLASRDMPNHPLRKAAVNSPKLLHRLDELASLRDRAAHDAKRGVREKIHEGVETVFDAVRHLFFS